MGMTKCMGCGNRTFDSKLDGCSTEGCLYNLTYENVETETEEERDENMHQGGDGSGMEDLPDHGEPGEGGDDKIDWEDPNNHDLEVDGKSEEKQQGDSGDMDLSKMDQPDDLSDERYDGGDNEDYEQERNESEDEDDDLPPRPMGCNGDCQPGDPGQESDPCPHCTAKQFKEEMENEGKGDLDPEELKNDFDDFLKQWQEKAKEDGNEPEGEGGEEGQSEDRIEYEPEDFDDYDLPDMEGEGDEGLPPRPQGCQGDCKPSDQYDEDADPCPHCTAKQFRDEMQKEQSENDEEGGEFDLEELLKKFQEMLAEWANEKEEHKHEEPPEEELNDGDEDDNKIEYEDDDEIFKRIAKELTVQQEKRFDNLLNRLTNKVKQMFGQTAEDIHVGAKSEGQFKGEEISQTIQISSRGVTYWITISAAKEI